MLKSELIYALDECETVEEMKIVATKYLIQSEDFDIDGLMDTLMELVLINMKQLQRTEEFLRLAERYIYR